MTALKFWLLAARPKTLLMSLTPLLVGGTLAFAENGEFYWMPWLAALLAAIGIQIGTNLHNDVSDYERGADTPERLGPRRATAEGWLSATAVRRGALISFGLSFGLGIYLVWLGGWPILLLGLASLLAGFSYTGGPMPIAYTPLGELFVLLFFGIAAVSGTYYLQTMTLSWTVVIAGIAVGLPAAAVLLINNYRDLETDLKAGKRTLATFVGRPVSRYFYSVMTLLPLVLVLPLVPDPLLRWLPWMTLPMIFWLIYQLWTLPIDLQLNALLAHTAQYQLLFGILLCLALSL
jgi:1,4-dihydroxy-2-naphthoate octaprenyltransferase